MTDCDTLVVEGRIEATLDARVLQIASNGVFQGTVAVDVAEIHGTLEGELTVRKQLVLHATGRVSGKIRYAKIKVEEGAEISVIARGAQGGTSTAGSAGGLGASAEALHFDSPKCLFRYRQQRGEPDASGRGRPRGRRRRSHRGQR